jgi:hypothetical protein
MRILKSTVIQAATIQMEDWEEDQSGPVFLTPKTSPRDHHDHPLDGASSLPAISVELFHYRGAAKG